MLNNEMIEKINAYPYRLAIFTDRADFIDALLPEDADKLLEIRAFDENSELRAFRSVVTEEFRCRLINDEGKRFIKEEQFLDIDTTRADTEDATVRFATGGGMYHLPVDAIKLKVHYYYCIGENGLAKKYDWRLAGFAGAQQKGAEE